VISGYITFLDLDRGYAVALANDKATEVIIHKAIFDKCDQPFRASSTPQAVRFEIESVLRRDNRTGVTHAIASTVTLVDG
jgi:hypothetical protein